MAFLLPSITPLFTAVPPSPNPKSKISKEFRRQLDNLVNLERLDEGRAWFGLKAPASTLTSLNARSVRIVAAKYESVLDTDDTNAIAANLVKNPSDIQDAVAAWKEAGNFLTENEPITFSITCRKWNSFVIPDLDRTEMRNVLSQHLGEDFDWDIPWDGQAPTFKFHLLLFESSAILELVALDRPMKTESLRHPGFKLVESFALVKSLDIQPGDVVIDPMCGKGTFLVEAATIWPFGKYYGMDTSTDQLQLAKENVEAAKVAVQLQFADAKNLRDWKDGSVDKIVCCPPFGRQFEKDSDNLYEELMVEWSRVLKDGGKISILLDEGNIPSMMDAIQKANCHVDQCRTPTFELGKIRATIILASKPPSDAPKKETEFGSLWWEHTKYPGRSLWSTMRSKALPSLVPYSCTR